MAEPAFLAVKPGSLVIHNGRQFKVTHLLGLDSVLGEDLETRAVERLRLDLIRPQTLKQADTVPGKDLEDISKEDWLVAQHRFEIIKPLLEDPLRTKKQAIEIAKQASINVATLYDWMKSFNDSGHIHALIPQKRGRKPGTRRLNAPIEAIIDSAIKQMYLNKQRLKPQDVVNEVLLLCRNAKIAPPHPNTVRNRLRELPAATVLRRRGMREKARNHFEPILGNFPGADYPLAVVQIDHTQADIIVVEENTRMSMGRPWVTLAIDCYSRMIPGYYISMERPSAVAAGMCLARSMLTKAEHLAELEVPGEWPVWGKMRTVHVDNAKEFRGAMLARACQEYAIDLQMRPVKRPHYGGHIERLMGTSANEIRKLPGATFSNPSQRKGYDSEKEAALTLREFEQHLVDFIVNVYHQRIHQELGIPPRRKWEIGILGDSLRPGIGVPDIPGDPSRIQVDFLPFIRRTVQPYGIVIDDIFYYHEVLNRWINAQDPDQPKLKRSFIIRRDPRDISRVYFVDPEAKQSYAIPYRNTTHPPISVWELKAAQERLKNDGIAQVDENAIFDAVARMRKRTEAAVTKTKAARRHLHRVSVTKTSSKIAAGSPPTDLSRSGQKSTPLRTASEPVLSEDIFSQPIRPFDDLGVKH